MSTPCSSTTRPCASTIHFPARANGLLTGAPVTAPAARAGAASAAARQHAAAPNTRDLISVRTRRQRRGPALDARLKRQARRAVADVDAVVPGAHDPRPGLVTPVREADLAERDRDVSGLARAQRDPPESLELARRLPGRARISDVHLRHVGTGSTAAV